MRQKISGLLAWGIWALLVSCTSDDNPANTVNASPYATACQKIVSDIYTLSFPTADSAVAVLPSHADTVYTCVNNTLIVNPVYVESDTFRFRYFVSGNYLNWIEPELERLLKMALGLLVPADSIDIYLVYKRQSTGSGLNGVWLPDSIAYVARGQLNLLQKAVLDSFVKEQSAAFRVETTSFFEIRGNTLTILTSFNTADQFLEQWAADSARYSITAEKLNECEVRLTGLISGEIVTVSGDDEGNIHFRGTSAEMPEHIYYPENPRSCPNTPYPPWWQMFLDHNVKQ